MQFRQTLRFCTARDGTRIAVASIGAGPPLVRAAHWLSHVEHDQASPVWRPWLAELARHHTYIRYDQRGCGLSDREVSDLLGRATDVVRAARVAITAGDEPSYAGLRRDLLELSDQLVAQREELG